MKRILKKIKEINYNHYISILIIIISIILNITIFKSSYIRIGEAFRDIYNSFIYYICYLLEISCSIEISVNKFSKVPFTPIFKLPSDLETFKINLDKYIRLLIDKNNITNYINSILTSISNLSKIIALLIIPLVIVIYILFKNYFNVENNKYNEDSKFLKFYKKTIEKLYTYLKNKILTYIDFMVSHKKYIYVLIFVWLISFNIITIIIEFMAYYMYFAVSFDFINIYVQIYKLLSDLSVMIAFIPIWVWVIVGYVIFDKIRCNIGYNILEHMEKRNCGFINERPIILMICGTMGKKKTTILTDIALSKEVLLKKKALSIISECDSKFPFFPFILFENELKRLIKEHKLINLAGCRKYIDNMEVACFSRNFCFNDDLKNELKKKCNYTQEKLLFGYDYEKYGLMYNNNLYLETLFDVLRTYAQVYFIYTLNSSLILSNYSVRSDIYKIDKNNFPMYNYDFFRRPVNKIIERSKYSHILDFDAIRLSKSVKENNKNKDSFDFGIVGITEIGKERKNQLELQGIKKDDLVTNQKNDGFNDWLKMVRHSATIDNFPFVKILTDEQRPESLGADVRDLCDICTIQEVSEFEITIPFFNIVEILHNYMYKKFNELYYKYRFNRSDNTLFMYLLKSFMSKFHNYYIKKHNAFDYCKCNIYVEQGNQKEKGKISKYYLMSKKIYSKRFSTDCFAEFFNEKNLKSKVGINDIEEYATERATFKELKKQNSYFIIDLENKKNNNIKGGKK